jgi:hypothetical protein
LFDIDVFSVVRGVGVGARIGSLQAGDGRLWNDRLK